MPVDAICPSCGVRLRVPSKLLTSGQPVTCPKCRTPVSAPSAALPEVTPEETVWYVARNQKRQGPFTSSQLQQLARSGQLRATDMLWQEGTPNWVQADSIAGLFTPLDPPPIRANTPVPEPLQPKAEWFERGLPMNFEPVKGVVCKQCQTEVQCVEVHGNNTVTCPGCGTVINLQAGFLAGPWQTYVRKVQATLEQWHQGGFGEDVFPEGAFSELKRQHEQALATAIQWHQTVQRLSTTPGSDPSRIGEARQQLVKWHGQATKLHEDRKRAVQQIMRAYAAGRMMRPGTRLVFTEDDVRSVPESMIPPPGSPEREGYKVIGEEQGRFPGEGNQSPFDQLDHTDEAGYQPRRRKSGKAIWLVLGLILALAVILPAVVVFFLVMTRTALDVEPDRPPHPRPSRSPKDEIPKQVKDGSLPKLPFSEMSEQEARAKLRIALDSWELKETPEEFKTNNPEITFADVDRAVYSLAKYEITALKRKAPPLCEISVRLTYVSKASGDESVKNTVYTVWKKSDREWSIVPTR